MRSFIPRQILIVLLVSSLVILGVATTGQAYTTYELTATPQPTPPSTEEYTVDPSVNYWVGGGFNLKYRDSDKDGLFSLDELIPGSFSGVNKDPLPAISIYPELIGVPAHHVYSPFTDGPTEGIWDVWVFSRQLDPHSTQGAAWNWAYTRTAVPLPPSALLLGAGLLGLAGWARRRNPS